jgi:hypothetical protein
VSGSAYIQHIEIALTNGTVQVGINKVQTRRGSPVSQQTGFDVFWFEGLAQERIVHQVDLPDGEIIGCSPVTVKQGEIMVGK